MIDQHSGMSEEQCLPLLAFVWQGCGSVFARSILQAKFGAKSPVEALRTVRNIKDTWKG